VPKATRESLIEFALRTTVSQSSSELGSLRSDAEGSAVVAEEIAEQLAAFGFANAPDHLGVVVEARVHEQVVERRRGACLGVVGPEHHPGHPGREHDPGAHGARFERRRQGCAAEPPVADGRGCIAQGQHLGVRGGIVGGLALVVARSDHLAADDHHSADRHLARRRSLPGLFQRQLDRGFVCHTSSVAAAARRQAAVSGSGFRRQ